MASVDEPAVCEWIDRETKVHCFRLSEKNKRTLLRNAAVAAAERLPRSKTFLERLQKLSPEFASQFGLRETAISEAPLRLLVSEDSKLVADPFFQVESYIVLSYCWHNGAWKTVSLCEKGWWPVSDVMMKVLQVNCKPEEGIWIDQLCIHQDNLDEQRLAISAMDQIYKSARKMYAVLEDIELSKADQDATIAFVSKAEIEPATAANLILKIAAARWFSRAWCSYEFKTSTFLAGNSPILIIPLQAPDTGLWQVEVMGFYPNHAVQNYILRPRRAVVTGEAALYMQFLGFLDPVGGRSERKSDADTDPDLTVQVLNRIERSGCQFITDYIPIILNTSGLDIIFSGTLHTKDELYYVVSILALAAGDPAVLSATGPKLLMPSTEQGEDVKSWIHHFGPMEWTIQGRLPEDLGVNSVSEDMLDLDLLILEDEPSTASFPAIDCATAFVYECYESKNPTLSQYYTSTNAGIPKTIARLGVNLATVLDLGLPWIRSAWSIFQKDMIAVEDRWTTFIQDDQSLWAPTVTHLLPYLLKSDPTPNSDPEHYRPLLVPFFSFFLFPTLRGNILSPQLIRTGPNPTDLALLDPNSNHHTTTPPLVKYAIPAALAASTFQRSMRVWILEELAPDGYLPQAGRPAMSYLVNQAERFGGTVTIEPVEPGDRSLLKVDIEPGTITDDTWEAIKREMTRVNMHEWIEEQRGGMAALEVLNRRSGCWRLVEKAVLWGCPTIVEDGGETVSLLKGQRVYGEAKVPVGVSLEERREGWKALQQLGVKDKVLEMFGAVSGVSDFSDNEAAASNVGEGDDTQAERVKEGLLIGPATPSASNIPPIPASNRDQDWPQTDPAASATVTLEGTLAKTHLEEAREQLGIRREDRPHDSMQSEGDIQETPDVDTNGNSKGDVEEEEVVQQEQTPEELEEGEGDGEYAGDDGTDGRKLTIFLGTR